VVATVRAVDAWQRPPQLVRWHGPVEGIFFHPLVIRPGLAFTGDWLGLGFQHFFVTAYEFRRVLQQLWRHHWTLVDAHAAATGDVLVPPGRKPLVLSEDDVNYYRYFDGRGLARRLTVDAAGNVRAVVDTRHGPQLSDDDVIPLVDQFVARHPDFSVAGAKGVLGLTGYEGLLGYRHPRRPAQHCQLQRLVLQLRQTGWSFASHTYGHIDLSQDSLRTIARDTTRWKRIAEPVIGPTDVLIYPFGARPTDTGVRYLRDHGFTIQFDIDVVARRVVREGATVMSRLHVDGYAFQDPQRMAPLFSVGRVIDPRRPWPMKG
jgi:hypothetical protein